MNDRRDLQTVIRLSREEREALDEVAADTGADSMSAAIRDLPRLVKSHHALMRAALEPLRGKLAAGEVNLILDCMNGAHLLEELLGQHVRANVADGIALNELHTKWTVDRAHLLGALETAPRAVLVAIELWSAWLWRRDQDRDLWDLERAWLVADASPR